MFLDYYKLREQPFGVTPDPRYLYLSPTHREALASLLYGVSCGRGFMALVARPGMGKTTLLRQLLQQIEQSAKTVFLFQTLGTPGDFLRSFLADIGVESDDGDLVRMHSMLNEALLREFRLRRRFVVVIDEAQNLDDNVLEVVRMLSNLETSSEKLLQIIIAGQPQLADKLRSPNLVQLRQRVSIFGRLEPFNPSEVNLYIDHRLRAAGCASETPLFTRRALDIIAYWSEGIPRNINNVCFNALSLGCALQQKSIDREVIFEVLDDLDVRKMSSDAPAVSKPESVGKYSVTQPSPRPERESILRRWLPRFAFAGALFTALSWPLIDATKDSARLSTSKNPIVAGTDSASFTELNVGVTPTRDSDVKDSETATASASIPASRTPSVPRVVRVKPYETLYRICADNFGRCNTQIADKIFDLNPWLVNPDSLRPGQEIRLPSIAETTTDVGRRIEHSSDPASARAGKQ